MNDCCCDSQRPDPPYPAAAPASTTTRPSPSRQARRKPGRCHSHRAGTPRIVRVGPSSVKGTRRAFLTASQKRSSDPPLSAGVSTDPAGLTARARPEARPEVHAANLSVYGRMLRTERTTSQALWLCLILRYASFMVAPEAPDNESLRLELQEAIVTYRHWVSQLTQVTGIIATADVVLLSYGFSQRLAVILLAASTGPIVILLIFFLDRIPPYPSN